MTAKQGRAMAGGSGDGAMIRGNAKLVWIGASYLLVACSSQDLAIRSPALRKNDPLGNSADLADNF